MIARVVLAAALSTAWLAAPADALVATASRSAVVALVWSALAGLPLARAGERPGVRMAFVTAALAPALGLAFALERAAGAAPRELGLRAALALWLCASAAWTAARARGSAPYALVWIALVAGLPLFAALLAWTSGGVVAQLAAAAAWSPLGWLSTWAAGAPAPPFGALAASLGLLALARRAAPAAQPQQRAPDASSPTARTLCLAPLVVLVAVAHAAHRPSATAPAFELGRAALVELALEGPLERFELVTEHGTTRVAAGLAAGETRRVHVPIAGAALVREPEISLALGAERRGAARLVDVDRRPSQPGPEALVRRTLPPLADATRRGAGGPALALLAAATLTVLGLRRRPAAALAAGLASGALMASFGALGRVEPRPLTIYEGERDAWLAVEVARGALALEPQADLALWVEPPASPLAFDVELGPPERWRAVAAGALLVRRAGWSPPAGWSPAAAETDLGSGLGALARGWRRAPDGLWSPLATPADARGEQAPPGWLAAGLPQGLDVLILELAAGADPAPPARAGAEAAGGERWLRWVGSLEKH